MIQCKKCGKWFEPLDLSGLCSDCQFTSTVSANTITPHDKLLVGMNKQQLLYEIKQTNQSLSLNYLSYLSIKKLEQIYKTEINRRKGVKK
jgi:hypothetical protein